MHLNLLTLRVAQTEIAYRNVLSTNPLCAGVADGQKQIGSRRGIRAASRIADHAIQPVRNHVRLAGLEMNQSLPAEQGSA